MNRNALLVESIPLDTAEEVFRLFGAALGSSLAATPDGEVGTRNSALPPRIFPGPTDLAKITPGYSDTLAAEIDTVVKKPQQTISRFSGIVPRRYRTPMAPCPASRPTAQLSGSADAPASVAMGYPTAALPAPLNKT